MKPDVLVHGKLSPHVMGRLQELFTLHSVAEAPDPDAALAALAPKIRAIATWGGERTPASLIDALPKLEIIGCVSVGTDAIDVAHAKERGVKVTNTPDVLNDDVANLAVVLLLATTRKLVAYDRYVRQGRWVGEGDPPLTRSIAGQQIGIVGLGRIGRDIARKLEVFGSRIAYFSRNERKDVPYRYYSDLVALARDSIALIVIVPGGAGTKNLIDGRVMEALGPEGILINVARGSVVDEPALVRALESGTLGGAGLDVFADEPNVPDALLRMENVVLQPHQGSATVETRRAMGDLMVDNLVAHFEGRPLLSPVV